MKTKPKMVLFGASAGGINAYHYLKQQYELIAFADNDRKKHGQTLNGYPIVPATALRDLPVDKIIIASTYGLQIHRQLVYEEQIAPDKIIRLSVSLLKKANPWYYFAALLVALFWIGGAVSLCLFVFYWI